MDYFKTDSPFQQITFSTDPSRYVDSPTKESIIATVPAVAGDKREVGDTSVFFGNSVACRDVARREQTFLVVIIAYESVHLPCWADIDVGEIVSSVAAMYLTVGGRLTIYVSNELNESSSYLDTRKRLMPYISIKNAIRSRYDVVLF